ncbi:hypothetical protein G7Y89_g10962 [Cudoniella acicularis]|uniref:Uncharacterized protein n=1 Tax=Cudoniella acicularis TaxID=354080 RepID=A0A8H4W0G1_9HELO|nr:hypothetical protein G7Y89_g10962 [Cudoniella acicularis]
MREQIMEEKRQLLDKEVGANFAQFYLEQLEEDENVFAILLEEADLKDSIMVVQLEKERRRRYDSAKEEEERKIRIQTEQELQNLLSDVIQKYQQKIKNIQLARQDVMKEAKENGRELEPVDSEMSEQKIANITRRLLQINWHGYLQMEELKLDSLLNEADILRWGLEISTAFDASLGMSNEYKKLLKKPNLSKAEKRFFKKLRRQLDQEAEEREKKKLGIKTDDDSTNRHSYASALLLPYELNGRVGFSPPKQSLTEKKKDLDEISKKIDIFNHAIESYKITEGFLWEMKGLDYDEEKDKEVDKVLLGVMNDALIRAAHERRESKKQKSEQTTSSANNQETQTSQT